MFHENDVKNIIKAEYKNFEKFYGNKLFSNILNNVINKTLDLSILAETVPFITTRIETSMISTKVHIKLLKFILLTLFLHIDITNIIDKRILKLKCCRINEISIIEKQTTNIKKKECVNI